MLLPDYAAIVALEKRSRDRSYGPYANTPGQNTGVEAQPHWEWGGDQHKVGCVDWDTRDDDQAGQMGRWTLEAEDFKPSSVPPPNPRPVEDDVISGNVSDGVVDSVMSAVPENTNTRNTNTHKRKGKELLLTPTQVRERHMDTSRSHPNPFFDNPNYRWKGEADTPALIEYMKKKLGVTVPPQNHTCFIRFNELNQNLDKSGMNVGDPLTPGSNQPQFVRESSTSKEGEISQTLSTTPQKRQNDVQTSIAPSKRRRGRRSLALPYGKPESPSSPNAIPTATATATVTVTNLDLVETLFSPIEYKGKQGFMCTYKCPHTGEICRVPIGGRDKRNQRRHLATHALVEKELLESGVIGMEDALVFTQLPKSVVKCNIQGCDYEVKVWRTDDVRKGHEMEVHPEQYAQRMQKTNAKSGGGD